ncbi:class I SAM-dependent methyltransferase [Sphingosinicella sp. BN140058]|uniref:class I SAM-dependent methyltransferase n=1 Tax=Sphingosinicella sp. BN140058 TaxID=1892855 RepID=UPI0010127C1A|nr:class I SAM-dependent methyltransferase [Sphingosinicella sp. BN140058]QAY75184.1 class I SAM-dependent methyltransferase [Sphingosinicella sp. BN140058]
MTIQISRLATAPADHLAALGIPDHRDYGDSTAGETIAEDIRLAELVAYAFDRTSTYRQLVGVYEALRVRRMAGEACGAAEVDEIVASSRHKAEPLQPEDTVHGHAILDKAELYLADGGFELHRGGTILENGASHGKYLHGFSANFDRVIAIDFCLRFLVLAKKLCQEAGLENVDLICASVERLPIASASIDFVHSNNVIEHVTNKAAMISEAHRVLAEEGTLFLLSPNHFSAYREPHFGLPFWGFIPERLRRAYADGAIKAVTGFGAEDVTLVSLGQLKRLVAPAFGAVPIRFIPRGLRSTVVSGRIRGSIVRALNSPLGGLTDLLINRLLLGIMPYHVAVCRKPRARPEA